MTESTREIILINVSGQDRPGLTTQLTAILGLYDIAVLDIGQSIIHDSLGRWKKIINQLCLSIQSSLFPRKYCSV